MLHEKAHAGKLVPLVQLGSIAENYLKPEMLSLEAEFLKYVNKMMEKQRQLVKELYEAGEEGRKAVIARYDKEMAETRAELDKLQSDHKETVHDIRDNL